MKMVSLKELSILRYCRYVNLPIFPAHSWVTGSTPFIFIFYLWAQPTAERKRLHQPLPAHCIVIMPTQFEPFATEPALLVACFYARCARFCHSVRA